MLKHQMNLRSLNDKATSNILPRDLSRVRTSKINVVLLTLVVKSWISLQGVLKLSEFNFVKAVGLSLEITLN